MIHWNTLSLLLLPISLVVSHGLLFHLHTCHIMHVKPFFHVHIYMWHYQNDTKSDTGCPGTDYFGQSTWWLQVALSLQTSSVANSFIASKHVAIKNHDSILCVVDISIDQLLRKHPYKYHLWSIDRLSLYYWSWNAIHVYTNCMDETMYSYLYLSFIISFIIISLNYIAVFLCFPQTVWFLLTNSIIILYVTFCNSDELHAACLSPSWSIKVSIAAQKFATSTLMTAPLKVVTIECIEHI